MGRRPDHRVTLFGPVPPPYGGVAVHVKRLHEVLLEAGFAARVVSFGNYRRHEPAIDVLERGDRHWPAVVAALLRSAGPGGLVHGHWNFATNPHRRLLVPLAAVARTWRLKWVESFHDGAIPALYASFTPSARRLFVSYMRGMTRVIAVSDEIRDFLVDVGVPEDRIVVVPPLLPPRQGSAPTRAEHRVFFDAHTPVWLALGALTPTYDFVTIAEAFRRFAEREPRAGLVFVVAGFDVDQPYAREVERRLAGMQDRILWLRDVPNEEVGGLLGAADLLVRGHRHESFGLSRIEALFAGTPVVATDTGQTRFMSPYRYGEPESLLDAAVEAMQGGRSVLPEAVQHYMGIARASLETIEAVYREFGVTPAHTTDDENMAIR
jgi:glycosyltransferase involved in cell wall biosynthesis